MLIVRYYVQMSTEYWLEVNNVFGIRYERQSLNVAAGIDHGSPVALPHASVRHFHITELWHGL